MKHAPVDTLTRRYLVDDTWIVVTAPRAVHDGVAVLVPAWTSKAHTARDDRIKDDRKSPVHVDTVHALSGSQLTRLDLKIQARLLKRIELALGRRYRSTANALRAFRKALTEFDHPSRMHARRAFGTPEFSNDLQAPAKVFTAIEGGHFACYTNPEGFVAALVEHAAPFAR